MNVGILTMIITCLIGINVLIKFEYFRIVQMRDYVNESEWLMGEKENTLR